MKLKDIKVSKAPTIKQSKGFILWQGISPYDNKTPIVAIATLVSKNDKTGDMIQTWILRSDIEPHLAVKEGSDLGICGDCFLKSGNGCYVRTEQAPLAVFRAFKKGLYKAIGLPEIALVSRSKEVRIGAYGDPAMVPYHIWFELTRNAAGYTGYTHQYKQPFFDPRMTDLCMVSTDTVEESKLLNEIGIRTFTPIAEDQEIPKDQLICPNVTHKIKCKNCLLCNGGKVGKSIIAPIHGTKQKIVKFIKGRG